MDYRLESGQIVGSDGQVYCLAELLGAEAARGVCENPESYSPRTGNIIGADGHVYNIVDLIAARNAMLADTVRYSEQTGKTDTEKTQARTNIGAASAADVTQLNQALVELEGVVTGTKISFAANKYINTFNNPISSLTPVSANDQRCAVISCSAGDKFVISGEGRQIVRLWTFVDSSLNHLSQDPNYGSGSFETNVHVTAPANAAYLIINQHYSHWVDCYYGEPLEIRVNEISDTLDNIGEVVEWRTASEMGIDAVVGYYDKNNCAIAQSATKNRVNIGHIPVVPGVKFRFNDDDNTSSEYWVNFYGTNGQFIKTVSGGSSKIDVVCDTIGIANVTVNTRYDDATSHVSEISGMVKVSFPKYQCGILPFGLEKFKTEFEYGTFDSNGEPSGTGTTRLRSTDFIPAGAGSILYRTNMLIGNEILMYDTRNKRMIRYDGSAASKRMTFTVPEDCYIKLLFGSDNGSFASVNEPSVYINPKPITDYTGIPTFYHTNSYIENKMSSISSHRGADQFGNDEFIFITDIHWQQNRGKRSPQLIDYIRKHTGIKKVFFGGDAVTANDTKAGFINDVAEYRSAYSDISSCDFYQLLGNHEYNNPGGGSGRDSIMLTYPEAYDMLIAEKEMQMTNIDVFSYYVDNTNKHIRYVMVGCDTAASITASTRNAVVSAINSTPNGWSIIVFSHVGLSQDGTQINSFLNEIVTALDALKAGGNVTPICVFSGHIHTDAIVTSAGGVKIVSTATDGGADETYTRTIGTISEQAFDIVQIDTANNHVYMTRIGAGIDRDFAY